MRPFNLREMPNPEGHVAITGKCHPSTQFGIGGIRGNAVSTAGIIAYKRVMPFQEARIDATHPAGGCGQSHSSNHRQCERGCQPVCQGLLAYQAEPDERHRHRCRRSRSQRLGVSEVGIANREQRGQRCLGHIVARQQ
jgi:hypothetical protein